MTALAQNITPVAPRILCVGTHHKTGTIWMQQVFKALSAALDVPKLSMWKRAVKRLPAEGRVLGTNWDSAFPTELMAREDVLFLHIIRDPRDVLLSGARYHETAPASKEDWLHDRHVQRPRGRTLPNMSRSVLQALHLRLVLILHSIHA